MNDEFAASPVDMERDAGEAMRRALVETLLRDCDGRLRVAGKTELSPAEQEWVQDIVSMVERSPKVGSWSPPKRRRPVRMRAMRKGQSRAENTPTGNASNRPRLEGDPAPQAEPEFRYVPITCGLKGAESKLSATSSPVDSPASRDIDDDMN